MAHAQRGTHRQPLQAFDNATYVKSAHQLAGQGPYNYNPLYERSQGFDLARPFDGRHPPQLYRDDADLYAMKSAWLAAQRSIPVSGEGIWPAIPKQTQVPLPRPSQLLAVGPNRAATSSARAGAGVNHGRTDPSTSSTTTNTTTSSSGDSGSGNSTDRSVACYACSTSSGGSDSVLSKRRTLRDRRVARSPPAKRQGRRVSWATCAPVVMMALMMAFLLLVSLAAMARSNRVMAAVSAVGRLNVNDRKPQLVMSSAATRVTVRAPGLVVRSSTSGGVADTRNMTRPRSTDKGAEGTTYADEADTLQVTASSKHARPGKPPKRSDVPEALAGDYENVDAGESSEHLMAFPFQRPTRPMCGDVFYTVCHPSTQPEFHYRRSVNACVETAADAVHSCNRGANRFASLTHCRRSCMRPGHQPAEECFGKPLFTSCARQDVLSGWWFFEGRKCIPWNFPSGGCPADDSAVFRSAQECRTQCVVGGLRPSPCRAPQAVACEGRHLKYPFFADMSMRDGRIRCMRSSPDVLRDRRCLTGANRFHTREACLDTCKKQADGLSKD